MSITLTELLVVLSLDDKGVDRSLAETTKKVDALADAFDRAENRSKRSIKGIGGAVDDLNRKTNKLSLFEQFNREKEARLDAFKSKIVGLGQSVGLTNNEMAGLAAAAPAVGGAIVAAGAGLLYATHNALEYAASLKDLSQVSGVGVETLSILNVAARQAGISIDSAASSAGKYFVKLSEAAHSNEEAEKTFARFGINAKKSILDPDQALKDLLTTLSKIPNAAERLEAAQKLAGKSGKELAAISLEMDGNWQKLEETARSLGVTIDRDLSDKADALGDAIELMKMKAEGAFLDLARGALPGLQRAVDDLTGKVGDNSKGWEQLGSDMGEFAIGAAGVINSIQDVGRWLDWMGESAAKNGALTREAFMPKKSIGGQMFDWLTGKGNVEPTMPGVYAGSVYKPGWDTPPANKPTPDKPAALTAPNLAGKRGGSRGGGSRGGSKKKTGEESALELQDKMVTDLANVGNNSRFAALQIELLQDKYKGMTLATRQYLETLAKQTDDTKEAFAITEKWRQLNEDLEASLDPSPLGEFGRALEKLNALTDKNITAEQKAVITIAEKNAKHQQTFYNLEQLNKSLEKHGDILERIATLPDPEGLAALRADSFLVDGSDDPHPSGLVNLLKQIDEAKDRLHDFKADFEDGFVNAFDHIGEGFDALITNMLSSFANMIQEMLLRAAAAKISEALFGGESGGTGLLGGFLKVLGIGVSTAAGGIGAASSAGTSAGSGFGGAFAGALHFADGGNYPANKPRVTGERGIELDFPGRAGQIISNEEIRAALGAGEGSSGGKSLTIGTVNFSFPGVRNPREAKATEAQMARAFFGMLERHAQLG